MGWDGHILLLFRSEEERMSRLAAWVRRGLARGEKVLYTEAETESPRRSMHGVLRRHGIDAAAAAAEGRLAMLPLPEFYPRGGPEEVVERALAEGYAAVRLTAEASFVLAGLSEDAYADNEQKLDVLCRTHPVSALCQYDQKHTTGGWLRRVAASHVAGIRDRLLNTGDSDGDLALAGEIDISNDDLLAYTLQAATSAATGTFRLDLSRVTFIGAGGCRALAIGTQEFRSRGGRLLVITPQPGVEQVLRTVLFDRLDRVELVGAQPGRP
jgi:anti-anti-sigma factor